MFVSATVVQVTWNTFVRIASIGMFQHSQMLPFCNAKQCAHCDVCTRMPSLKTTSGVRPGGRPGPGGSPGPGLLRRPPPPPTLEIGTEVPDHQRQRRPKANLLEPLESKNGFSPYVCILKILSFFRRTQLWMKTNLDQISILPLCNGMSEMAHTLVGKAVPLHL